MVVENLRASRENMFLKQKVISKIFDNSQPYHGGKLVWILFH